jgi:hypothetical protein
MAQDFFEAQPKGTDARLDSDSVATLPTGQTALVGPDRAVAALSGIHSVAV